MYVVESTQDLNISKQHSHLHGDTEVLGAQPHTSNYIKTSVNILLSFQLVE